MSERRLWTEICHGEGFFERKGAGHNLTIDRPQRFRPHRARIQSADAVKDSAFAMGRVDFLAGLELDLADSQDVTGSFVEEFDDMRVQPVDGLAVVRNVHSLGV